MASPVDPPDGPRYVLLGRVVTMRSDRRVHDRGAVCVDRGRIAAVEPEGVPLPEDFADCPRLETKGTIYPGLIELHNHLSYDILPRWGIDRRYANRAQWSGGKDYHDRITGPMRVLSRVSGGTEAIVRYVEGKCLLGGVTTSQGIALFSNQGIRRYYRGLVRNVEETGETDLPEARARIADVEADGAAGFFARLKQSSCLLLHLSEGVDQAARAHFQALHLSGRVWAITPALAGIHCAGLTDEDWRTMGAYGGALVWSPLSNLLLYGETAKIAAAKANGVTIGLGADWSPTGSKNLLHEMKAAYAAGIASGGLFSAAEIVAMATVNAAKILKWDHALGALEPGKRADLLVIEGTAGDPYEKLLRSGETAVVLVAINGMPRYGRPDLLGALGLGTESWQTGGRERLLHLRQETADPAVGGLTLRAARERLTQIMHELPGLAGIERTPALRAEEEAEPQWYLLLDHAEPAGEAQRPHLPFQGRRTAAVPDKVLRPAEMTPLVLDPPTVADDGRYLDDLATAMNIPAAIKGELARLY